MLASVSAKLVDSYNYGDDGDYDSNYFYTPIAAFHSHLSSILVVLCSPNRLEYASFLSAFSYALLILPIVPASPPRCLFDQ